MYVYVGMCFPGQILMLNYSHSKKSINLVIIFVEPFLICFVVVPYRTLPYLPDIRTNHLTTMRSFVLQKFEFEKLLQF